MGTIIVVHGTGVRLQGFLKSFEIAEQQAKKAGLTETLVKCAWGDALGVTFEQLLSLPDEPSPERRAEEQQDLAQWQGLFDDPLLQLYTLTIPDPKAKGFGIPGQKPQWQVEYDAIRAYVLSDDCRVLLERGALAQFWTAAFHVVVNDAITRKAFETSAHELPSAIEALSRAVIAQLHVDATKTGFSGPSRDLRKSLFEQLREDWKGNKLAAGFLSKLVSRQLTALVRTHRENLSHWTAHAIGDILLYQSHGQTIRDFIRKKVEKAKPPVTLMAHSLGGIACVDLLALPEPPEVRALVTVGSQAPLLCELGALKSLQPGAALPAGFPRWLNVYDRNDVLSYVAHRLWNAVEDFEVTSGQPLHEAHGAYFGNAEVWAKVRAFAAP